MKKKKIIFFIMMFLITLILIAIFTGCPETTEPDEEDEEDEEDIITVTFNLIDADLAHDNLTFACLVFEKGETFGSIPVATKETKISFASNPQAKIVFSDVRGIYDVYCIIDVDGSGINGGRTSGDRVSGTIGIDTRFASFTTNESEDNMSTFSP